MATRRIPGPRSLWRHGPHPSWAPLILIFVVALVIVHRGQSLVPAPSSFAHRDVLEEASGVIYTAAELEREVQLEREALKPTEAPLQPLFLFVGVLSGRGYRHRRLAVREAWATEATKSGLVETRFVLSQDERTPQVVKELDTYGDIIFIQQRTNYKSILYKTYYVRNMIWEGWAFGSDGGSYGGWRRHWT